MKTRLLLTIAASASMLAACASMVPTPPYKYKEPEVTLRLALLPHDTLAVGKSTDIDMKLNTVKDLTLIKDSDLDVVHMQKIHLLVVDSTLTDYQHVHPEPTGTPGIYHFHFTPQMAGNYHVWADVTLSADHKQHYVLANLGTPRLPKINKTESSETTVGAYHFTLSFDKAPTAGNESMGTVHITDSSGKPVASLQPLMGAYAHVVGFYDDFRTVVHTHPVGDEPKNDKNLGGPDLTFHLMPVQPGFVKFFVQVKIGSKELYVPFGINVAPAVK